MRPTKEQIKDEIVAILNRATTPHDADHIYQKMKWHHHTWSIDRESIYRLAPELVVEQRIASLGQVKSGPHETTLMYAALTTQEQRNG